MKAHAYAKLESPENPVGQFFELKNCARIHVLFNFETNIQLTASSYEG